LKKILATALLKVNVFNWIKYFLIKSINSWFNDCCVEL